MHAACVEGQAAAWADKLQLVQAQEAAAAAAQVVAASGVGVGEVEGSWAIAVAEIAPVPRLETPSPPAAVHPAREVRLRPNITEYS